ncbi:MAG: hydroxyethylthiazole kinase [Galactobacter sp.]
MTTTDPDLARAAPVIAAVRERAPMVHCVTATVSMGIVADGLLAAGARPMMTETVQEAPVVTALADALAVNFGTLSTDGMDGIPATVKAARRAGHPWVLDPTAIGVAPIRTAMAKDLLHSAPTVIRGNASEILALRGAGGGRGADSSDAPDAALSVASEIAGLTGAVVAVSGATDLIVDPESPVQALPIARGDAMLTRVTGTGCLLGALTAACTVVAHPLDAAASATIWLNLAGERAAARAAGPGSFRVELLDALDQVGHVAASLFTPTPERNAQT